MQTKPYRIGTRGSPLALAQAYETRDRLMAAHELPSEMFEIVVLSTKGDRITDRSLSEIGGKGLFTLELEEQLLSGELDFAVHSTKDMPTKLPDGLHLAAYLPREDARDAFIGRTAKTLLELPQGATIGSSSLRRQALIKRLRPDINVVTFRGLVDTRLRKLQDGEVDATLLAYAGLKRLGKPDVVTELLDPAHFLPAPAQGAICIECRTGDTAIENLLAGINDKTTFDTVRRGREFPCRGRRLSRDPRRIMQNTDCRPRNYKWGIHLLFWNDTHARWTASSPDYSRRPSHIRLGNWSGSRRGNPFKGRTSLLFILELITMRVLVTRPQPGADRTASRLISLGHTPVILPLFKAFHFRDIAVQMMSHPCSAIVMTSAEAFTVLEPVRDQITHLFPVPIFAVGSATAEVARNFGFNNIFTGTSGGADLADMICEQAKSNRKIIENLFYLAGQPRSNDLESQLAAHKIRCRTETVYEMRPTEITEGELRNVIVQQAPDAILFYSAEATRRFFNLATINGSDNMVKDVRLLCLSRNIAAVIPQNLEKNVEISIRADETSLMDLLSQA